MTGGGPSDATLSIVLLMYEEGFRWWNLGYAAAIAVVLFAIILATTLLPLGLLRRRAVNRSRTTVWALHGTLAVAVVLTLLPLWWMLVASLSPAGAVDAEPLRLIPRALTAEHYEALFTRLPLARSLANSALVAGCVTVLSCWSTPWRATRSPSYASPDATPSYACFSARWSSPRRWRCCRSSCCSSRCDLVNSYGGVIVPGCGQHLRHLSDAPVRALDSGQPARRSPHRRGERAAHLPVRRAAALPAHPRHDGDLHLPRHLERLPLAADRALRRGRPDAAGRAGESLRRARAGHRAR